ncbi:anthranilate synthase component I [Blautia schinkii]|nr:anthranilate synthase component I [Blautia schinkii]
MKTEVNRLMELAGEYPILPVSKEIYADIITPIGILKKLTARSKRCFLLESVEGSERWARYSFLGYEPLLRITGKDHKVTIERNDGGRITAAGMDAAETITSETASIITLNTENPLEIIRGLMKEFRAPSLPEMPPFAGGLVGYYGYSMIHYAEPELILKSGDFPDFDLMLFEKVIVYDHLKQKIQLIYNMKTDRLLENYGKATAALERMAAFLREPVPAESDPVPAKVDFTCNFSKEEYCRVVEKTKEYIRKGDIFQAVISRQFESAYSKSLLNAYRVLRTTNPSPYMVYLKIDDLEVMCSSPETLVRLEHGRLTTFPVAGSRPRGADETEDIALEKELLSDEKELSEHNMLVDLGRNDLGKISRFGSVEVTRYKMIHRYSRIMHICSQVEGDIREDFDGLDAVEAVLPAGTLSGAPKIRACQIIEELEKAPRGIYGGALGYLDFTGNLDTCIAIRMAVKKNGKVYVQAGGGIVADSIPEKEYEESANKAQAVMRALKQAEEVER